MIENQTEPKALTPSESQVMTGLMKGLSLQEVADTNNMKYTTAKTIKSNIRRKIGQEAFAEQVAAWGPLPLDGVEYLKSVLTSNEFEAFVLIRMGRKSPTILAESLNTTPATAKTYTNRIKEKLGIYYDQFLDPQSPIPGFDDAAAPHRYGSWKKPGSFYDNESLLPWQAATERAAMGLPEVASDNNRTGFLGEPPSNNGKEENKHCFNCANYQGALHLKNERVVEVYCRNFNKKIFDDSSPPVCKNHTINITQYRPSEQEEAEALMQDPNFLQMARIANTHEAPTNPIEKSQYSIAGLGFTMHQFKQRRKVRSLLEQSARNMLISLPMKEAQRPEVRHLLDAFKMQPEKRDFDGEGEEDGKETTVLHYVAKSSYEYNALMNVLIGGFIITGEEDENGKSVFRLIFDREVGVSSVRARSEEGSYWINCPVQPNAGRSSEHIFELSEEAYEDMLSGQYIVNVTLGEAPGGAQRKSKYEFVMEKKVTFEINRRNTSATVNDPDVNPDMDMASEEAL